MLHSEKRIVDESCQNFQRFCLFFSLLTRKLVFGFPKKKRKDFWVLSLQWLVLALTFSLVDLNFLIVLAAKGTFRKIKRLSLHFQQHAGSD